MVAALIAFTMVSLASADGFKGGSKKIMNISFERAIKTPGLVFSMYQQLSPDMLLDEKPVYVVYLIHQGTTYRITGTREQWVKFFTPKWKINSESKPSVGISS